MNCIAVDDEPLALDIIEDFIKEIPFLKLVKKCYSASEAIEIIQNENIDLVFLDIRMPSITGVQLVKSLKDIPAVIFTTAYTDYAVEGFNLDAVDYLVKPFSFERFLKAVNKAYSLYKLKNDTGKDYIFIKSGYKNLKVDFNDILYIEGLSDYIKIYLVNGKNILSLQSLKVFIDKLPENDFLRVHRSYIVSLNKIDSIQKSRIFIGEKHITVGEKYKDKFLKRINL